LKNQDFVWGYALIISGALAALAVARYGASRLRKEELLGDKTDWKLGRWWDVVLVGFVPSGAMILLVWWLVKEAKPGTWYNPLDPTSVMNCLVQWFVALSILWLMGRWLARRSLK
jgi:NSS family neurotransmitter:Na+ symporter